MHKAMQNVEIKVV